MMSTTSLTLPAIVLLLGAVSACGSDAPGGNNQALAGTGGALPADGTGAATGGSLAVGNGGSPVVGNGGSPASGTGGGSGSGSGSGGLTGTSTGGTTGQAGASDASTSGSGGTPASDAGPPRKPPCLSDASQLVLIGDSYINWVSHTFPTDINAASGLQIGNFAIGGTSMGSGGIGLIAPQFETAQQTHPNILAVIMDGGGNDVLVPDTTQFPQGGQCKMMGAQSPSIVDCQKIVAKAIDAGRQLFLHMASQGVKDALFFFYPHVPTNTLVGGTDPNGMLDYALPKIQAECDNAYAESSAIDPQKAIRCHFVNLVPVFEGHPEFFAPTDIHPNSTGSKAMATVIWSRMKQDCIAQPASSGCCEPQ